MSADFKKHIAALIPNDTPPVLTKETVMRLRKVAEAFVHQTAAIAAESARDTGGRKTIAPKDMVISARHLLGVYPWIDDTAFFTSAVGHVPLANGELQNTDTLYVFNKGRKKIATRGLLTIKSVEQLLKTTRKATRDSNAIACRMGEEFGICIVVRCAQILNKSALEAKDIDTILCGKKTGF